MIIITWIWNMLDVVVLKNSNCGCGFIVCINWVRTHASLWSHSWLYYVFVVFHKKKHEIQWKRSRLSYIYYLKFSNIMRKKYIVYCVNKHKSLNKNLSLRTNPTSDKLKSRQEKVIEKTIMFLCTIAFDKKVLQSCIYAKQSS